MPASTSLRELTRIAHDIAERQIRPRADEEDREGRWPAPAMRALAEAGLMGLHVPARLGGHGLGLEGLVEVTRVLAQGSASTALCYAMHCVGTAVIAAKATRDHEERYLIPIAQGRHITTLALSEPGTGAHFYIPQTSLQRCDGGYVVDGRKGFVTNGGHADSYVVSTQAAEGRHADEGAFSCVLVEKDAPGVRWQDDWDALGMRSNSARTAELHEVRIPRSQLLGEEGDELWYVFEVIAPYFLMAMAGTYLGVAERAFDIAAEYVGTRRYAHTGELLGSAPVVSHRLGALWIDVERTRRLILSAAQRADAGEHEALASVLASKAAAGDTAVTVVNEAMTLCGGSAYRSGSELPRLLRDARASHVMAPTTDLLKTWIGRALLGLPLV